MQHNEDFQFAVVAVFFKRNLVLFLTKVKLTNKVNVGLK